MESIVQKVIELLDFLDTVNERAEKFPISMDKITKEVEKARPL